MSLITAHDLHKSFGPQTILAGVSLSIQIAERVGLVGMNGSGKSTLARILAKTELPDSGTVVRQREADVGYLEQNPLFEETQTPREAVMVGLRVWSEAKARHEAASQALSESGANIEVLVKAQAQAASDVERLGGWDRTHMVESILGHLKVSNLDAGIHTLSGGERRRVALARILVAQPMFTVLDEPTNHLDVETVEWLERYLIEEHKGALLLITHDRYLLDRVVKRTLELDQGNLYSYEGGYEEYLEAKAERLAHSARTEQNRQNFLRTELEWLRRQPKARTGKQKARIDRAESAKNAPVGKRSEQPAELSVEQVRSGKTIVDLQGLVLEVAGRRLVKGLDLALTRGERMGIVGPNGSGKTTLLKAICGEIEPAQGSIVRGQNTRIAYFDQERAGLDDNASIWDNVAGDVARIEINGQSLDVRTYLERFLFDSSKQRQKVGSLSGGERARVALAKLLRQSANLVLLDEPTNDLDLATLGALEQMLTEFGGTALVVTHDRWFLNRVATAILAFEGDGRVVRYAGNYDLYRQHRATALKQQEEEKSLSTTNQNKTAAPKANPLQKKARVATLTYAETWELESIADTIDKAECAVKALETRLSDPVLYAKGGGEEARVLVQELDEARAEAARLLARWEELEAKRERYGRENVKTKELSCKEYTKNALCRSGHRSGL